MKKVTGLDWVSSRLQRKCWDSIRLTITLQQKGSKVVFGDIKAICSHIDSIANVNGLNTVGKSRDELTNFFNLVATVENGLLSANQRAACTQWRTAVRAVARDKQCTREAN